MGVNSIISQTYNWNIDETLVENHSDSSARIKNEDEVSIAIKMIVNKRYISSFAASFGGCILQWHRIERPMTPNVKFFFNLQKKKNTPAFRLPCSIGRYPKIVSRSPIFLPTTISSCSSGQKAGLTQSSFALSFKLPVYTD